MAGAEPSSSILLPHWESEGATIRFLYLSDCASFKIGQSCDAKESMVPLFLGADLFSKTNIRTENHPRYHAKFAKKGLATKLIFASVFELYSQHEQLFMLETFQELWKSRLNDGPLNPCYFLAVQLDPLSSEDIVRIHDRELQLKLNSLNLPQDIHSPQVLEGDSTAHQEDEGPPMGTSASDHDYCRPAGTACPHWHHSICQKIRSLSALMEGLTGEVGREKQERVSLLLENTEQCLRKGLDERGLADLILGLLESQRQDDIDADSVYCSPLLCTIANWLGRRFHAANSCISQQVESFKMRHIDRITDLPPAEELVAELFPEAMQALLLNWMGLSDTSALWKRHTEYPILLLILEFANHNLITGVAHVLYSSLICK